MTLRSSVATILIAMAAWSVILPRAARAQDAALSAQDAPLPAPAFHHLHLNSVDPEAAIEFYTEQFPSTSPATFAGEPALRSPTDVWILFSRVDAPPPTQPQSAFWHFGWHVTDVHRSLELFREHGVTLLPLYTEEGGGTVFTSGDTWPSNGGVGLTREEIAEAKARGVEPTHGAGFAYLRGPDDAIVEYQGDRPVERFNHIHMYMEQPYCAELWYERHLNVPSSGRREGTEADCAVERGSERTWPALEHDGMYRTPALYTLAFGDVALYAYMNQTDTPLASSRGQLMDHFGLRVDDLDSWIAKLRAEGVRFLEDLYETGGQRAIMIEGPSREAIELIEIRR